MRGDYWVRCSYDFVSEVMYARTGHIMTEYFGGHRSWPGSVTWTLYHFLVPFRVNEERIWWILLGFRVGGHEEDGPEAWQCAEVISCIVRAFR
jgi:hypothetical protein